MRQTIIEMESAFLFVIAAGQGTCLAVLTSAEPNVGVIAYEMAMLVRRMGKYLDAQPRFRAVDVVERLGDGRYYETRLANGGERHKPNPVGERGWKVRRGGCHRPCHLEGQACFARARSTREGDEPDAGCTQQVRNRRNVPQ